MSWKAHLPNFANWASSTIAKLSQVFTTSSQIRRPRKWKLSERGTLECVENICDLIISPCQSVSCNASREAWVTQFAYFPLNSHKLWHHFHSLTSLKSSSMSTRFQKRSGLQSFIVCWTFVKYFSQENRGDKNCKNGEKHFVEPVMHPNLCVCFHSAVTFWLNDRLTVCWKVVNCTQPPLRSSD